jgi:protein-disulfide isomerase
MNEQPEYFEERAADERLTRAERKRQRREDKQRERERQRKRGQTLRTTRWVAVALAVVAVVGGIIFIVGRQGSGDGLGKLARVADPATDWTKGSPEAATVLVEYGDFQCPACGSFQPIVKSISEELGDDLLVVYRHFPLRQIHPNAELAAQAAEAAGRQGKFWEMHDTLFERQDEWSDRGDARDLFVRYAEDLGVNREQFEADLGDASLKEAVEEDYRSGVAAGVGGTPTFYLNGEELSGYSTFDDFKERIRSAARENS